MVDIMDKLQKVANIGKSPKEKQKFINVNEVFYVWDIMVTKFDMLETIQIFENMIEDNDLIVIKNQVKKGLTTGIEDMEKYSVMHVTNTIGGFVKDEDLKLIINMGHQVLNGHIELLENKMMNYGIPLPIRPPKKMVSRVNLELISDRHIYRRILRGIQAFIPVHSMAFIHSTSPVIRDLFISFATEEMKIYDKLIEYGKMKEYLIKPPMYRI